MHSYLCHANNVSIFNDWFHTRQLLQIVASDSRICYQSLLKSSAFGLISVQGVCRALVLLLLQFTAAILLSSLLSLLALPQDAHSSCTWVLVLMLQLLHPVVAGSTISAACLAQLAYSCVVMCNANRVSQLVVTACL